MDILLYSFGIILTYSLIENFKDPSKKKTWWIILYLFWPFVLVGVLANLKDRLFRRGTA